MARTNKTNQRTERMDWEGEEERNEGGFHPSWVSSEAKSPLPSQRMDLRPRPVEAAQRRGRRQMERRQVVADDKASKTQQAFLYIFHDEAMAPGPTRQRHASRKYLYLYLLSFFIPDSKEKNKLSSSFFSFFFDSKKEKEKFYKSFMCWWEVPALL